MIICLVTDRRRWQGGSLLTEQLDAAVSAGIDLIQHPEILTPRDIPEDLIQLIRGRHIICSMLVSTITGEAWEKHLKDKAQAEKKLAACKRWANELRHHADEYESKARRLAGVLEADLPNAGARLEKQIEALEAYVKLAPPPGPKD